MKPNLNPIITIYFMVFTLCEDILLVDRSPFLYIVRLVAMGCIKKLHVRMQLLQLFSMRTAIKIVPRSKKTAVDR